MTTQQHQNLSWYIEDLFEMDVLLVQEVRGSRVAPCMGRKQHAKPIKTYCGWGKKHIDSGACTTGTPITSIFRCLFRILLHLFGQTGGCMARDGRWASVGRLEPGWAEDGILFCPQNALLTVTSSCLVHQSILNNIRSSIRLLEQDAESLENFRDFEMLRVTKTGGMIVFFPFCVTFRGS